MKAKAETHAPGIYNPQRGHRCCSNAINIEVGRPCWNGMRFLIREIYRYRDHYKMFKRCSLCDLLNSFAKKFQRSRSWCEYERIIYHSN